MYNWILFLGKIGWGACDIKETERHNPQEVNSEMIECPWVSRGGTGI